jgi:hypothetical protein
MAAPKEPTIATRVPQELLKRIKKFQSDLAKERPGVKVKQSDAMRVLLERGLEASQ